MNRAKIERERKAALARWQEQIIPGAKFSTASPDGEIIESGCEVITTPDEIGNFDAYDSEGVICSFPVVMVAAIDERV